MAIEKLNDEELDIVTGGRKHENLDLEHYFKVSGCTDMNQFAEWLKANLQIDCRFFNNNRLNEYSTTKDGVKQTLNHEKVLCMIDEFLAQHLNG